MTKQRVLIERFTGRDLRNKKVEHLKVTPFYLDSIGTYRLAVKFPPQRTSDPEIQKRLHALWREMIRK